MLDSHIPVLSVILPFAFLEHDVIVDDFQFNHLAILRTRTLFCFLPPRPSVLVTLSKKDSSRIAPLYRDWKYLPTVHVSNLRHHPLLLLKHVTYLQESRCWCVDVQASLQMFRHRFHNPFSGGFTPDIPGHKASLLAYPGVSRSFKVGRRDRERVKVDDF
ncbi:hypothetical protein ARMGADRAFT_38052 [Armillaria gallica]|uniref:Uncharacterized protein n=1 Tax=Armillaria gallica TaxID=47427 RepID=A0A2H3EU64_ARMGA|nr:hypothetical protein ARMGADRAFT_38052 [Armillaria gallica]